MTIEKTCRQMLLTIAPQRIAYGVTASHYPLGAHTIAASRRLAPLKNNIFRFTRQISPYFRVFKRIDRQFSHSKTHNFHIIPLSRMRSNLNKKGLEQPGVSETHSWVEQATRLSRWATCPAE